MCIKCFNQIDTLDKLSARTQPRDNNSPYSQRFPLRARFNNRYDYINEAYEKLDEKAKKRRKV